MKKNLLYIVVFLTALFSCQDSMKFQDVLYITGTETKPERKLIIDGTADMGITVQATKKLEKDVAVTLDIDESLLSNYNKKNNRNYQIPPKGSFQLTNKDVLIKSGSYLSTQARLSILSSDEFKEGVVYCLPITIKKVKADIGVLEASRTNYIILNKVIVSKVVDLNSRTYFSVPSFIKSSDVSALNQVTMECKVYVQNFQDFNPYISSVMGIEENFLLRFGDVSCDKDQLQLSAGMVGGKKFPITSKMKFSTNMWYHIAVVYDGRNSTLYVNGEKESFTSTSGGVVNFNDDYCGGFHIGFSERGRLLDGYVSEARVWNRALTSTELQDNVCYVDPTSEGLLAYWRFNGESEDGKVLDLTGHGHDAIATGTINWAEGARCPF